MCGFRHQYSLVIRNEERTLEGQFPTILHLRWNLSSTKRLCFGHQEHMQHGNPIGNDGNITLLLMGNESGVIRKQIDSIINSYITTITI